MGTREFCLPGPAPSEIFARTPRGPPATRRRARIVGIRVARRPQHMLSRAKNPGENQVVAFFPPKCAKTVKIDVSDMTPGVSYSESERCTVKLASQIQPKWPHLRPMRGLKTIWTILFSGVQFLVVTLNTTVVKTHEVLHNYSDKSESRGMMM